MLCVGVELGRSRCVGRERDGVALAVVDVDWAEVTGRKGGRCDMQVGMAAECCCWSIQQPRNDRTGEPRKRVLVGFDVQFFVPWLFPPNFILPRPMLMKRYVI